MGLPGKGKQNRFLWVDSGQVGMGVDGSIWMWDRGREHRRDSWNWGHLKEGEGT